MQFVRCLIAGVALVGLAAPAFATDPTNHNTTRSNKASGVVASEDGDGQQATNGSDSENAAPANHNTTRSNKASGLALELELEDSPTLEEAPSDVQATGQTGEYDDKYIIEKRKK